MSKFDYKKHKIIGVARKKYQGAQYASINPLGYQDDNYHFQPFNKEDIKAIFTPNNTIFGGKIPDHLINELITFSIIESESTDDSTKDFFCRDYETRIEKYADPITNTDKQGLIDATKKQQYDNHFKVDNKIYLITEKDSLNGIAKYWNIEDGLFEANHNLCRCEDDIYLIRDSIKYTFSFSDIWSYEQIISFIINLIKTYNINIQNITSISEELIRKMDLPSDILKHRFRVFNSLLSSIVLTHKNILDLASNSILSDVLQKSIKEYENEYIKTYENHHSETIKKMELSKTQKLKDIDKECEIERKAHLLQLKLITDEIDKGKAKLNEISKNIKKKEIEAKLLEQRFIYIEGHKNRLIEDFSVIKDVIGGQIQGSQQSILNNIESVTSDGKAILKFEDFCSHIVAHLLRNKFSEDSAMEISQNISRLFVAKKSDGQNLSVILLPNLIIFKSLIGAIGQYKLCSIGIAPNWKSYDNLYYNFLGEMIISAMNNPNDIHIVLLQNMNLSYIPSYMQPINDVLIGIRSKLPGDHDIVGIPSNLWIFGTRTNLNEEAIPISKSNIEEYGCLENKDYTYSEGKSIGNPESKYITMDFVNTQREEERRYKSYPESYLD